MAEGSSAKRSFLIWVVIILSQLVLIISLVSGKLVETVAKKEVSMMQEIYGADTTDRYVQTAGNITNKYLIDNGAVKFVRDTLLPRSYLRGDVRVNYEKDYNSLWEKVDNAITNLVKVANFTLIRIVSLLAWFPLLVLLMVGAVTSGYLQREIKKEGFEYSSPLRHGLAKKVIFTLPVTFYIIVLLPIAINPIIFAALVVLISILSGWYVSNTIKRV